MKRPSQVTVDSHPTEDAIVVRTSNETQQVINLKDLSQEVDVRELASIVISKAPLLSEVNRTELEQVLFYLKKRKSSERGGSASSSATNSTVAASIDEVDGYLELFYEGIEEKKRAALLFQELARNGPNLRELAENEAIMGALARVYREDWKKNFELAIAISSVFIELSRYHQFQSMLTHHKIGALCLTTVEYELKRGETWAGEAKSGDEKNSRRLQLALKKQQVLLAGCIEILTNLADDLAVEIKIVRRDFIPQLVKCSQYATTPEMRLAVVRMLLKMSIFQENLTVLENTSICDTIIAWFPIDEVALSKACVRFLFNLVFNSKVRTRMVKAGLVSHIASLIKNDTAALHLLYQLSIDDEGKAMIKFTDSIQLLMRDLLSGDGSDVTKAVLLNVCVEKRNAQLVCGTEGAGLDLLMEMSLDHRDLLVAKILRTIATHEGPTQDMFLKWMPKLIGLGKTEAIDAADDRAAIGLEWMATAALIKSADWSKLITTNDLVSWMRQQLTNHSKEAAPLQLQIAILSGTMARHIEAARHLVSLVDTFLNLLHTLQTDDEYVLQLLYFLLQLLRHKELSDELMGPDSAVGSYFVDLMHDRNTAIREMCDNALIIIGEHSQDWARKIAGARFRWHNEQWLSMIEAGQEVEDGIQPDDDFGLIFNDQFDDFSDETGLDTP